MTMKSSLRTLLLATVVASAMSAADVPMTAETATYAPQSQSQSIDDLSLSGDMVCSGCKDCVTNSLRGGGVTCSGCTCVFNVVEAENLVDDEAIDKPAWYVTAASVGFIVGVSAIGIAYLLRERNQKRRAEAEREYKEQQDAAQSTPENSGSEAEDP